MSKAKTACTVASAACLAISCTQIKRYEGFAPTVVPDRLANGLPTGGYGETEGVKLGETHSEKYWSDRLSKRIADEYDAGIGQCIHVELPDGVRAMAISDAYNAGVAAVCHSPMVAKWNAGDIVGGCRAIRGWRVTSHPRGPNGPAVVQRGLVNRRNDESAKCVAYARGELKAPPLPAVVAEGDFLSTKKAEQPVVNAGAKGDLLAQNLEPAPVVKPAPAPKVEAPKSRWRLFLCGIFKCKPEGSK